MTKFKIKAITLAVASVCGSAAYAGSITAPTTATPYAVESMTATTDLTLPPITYTMGVARTIAQDFTMIFTPSAGASFTANSCAAALAGFAQGGAGTVVVTQKRQSTTECAYEVDVTADTDTTKTLTFNGFVLDTHTLNTAGSSFTMTLALKDLGETAFIDNVGPVTKQMATSGNALTLTAAQDAATLADVNDEVGPLFGFVTVGDDADAVAAATFVVGNNNGGTNFVLPDGVTPWDFTLHGTKIDVTVAGNFQGLQTGGFFASPPLAGPIPSIVSNGTATFTLLPANLNSQPSANGVTTTFTSARTASLGTSRTFGVSAVGDVQTGADVALAGSSSWWVWGANASQLMTPYFTTFSAYQSRFFLLNNSTDAVTYSAECFAETGNAITYGSAKSGSLAVGLNKIDAADICTFAGATRGSVIFTINAPIEKIKGSYQAVNPATYNLDNILLVRPYAQAKTTE